MIIVNGQPVDEEQFFKQQEQAFENERKTYDCNYAIIQQVQGMFGVNSFQHICSLTRKEIPNLTYCKECVAHNNTDYTNL